ncbi:MAG: hypothetical protein JWO43_428 [Candidatus Adlerbacteria bacterium]|nr:hypothetical protein [Candidatus Adlerbacteria bacterium]
MTKKKLSFNDLPPETKTGIVRILVETYGATNRTAAEAVGLDRKQLGVIAGIRFKHDIKSKFTTLAERKAAGDISLPTLEEVMEQYENPPQEQSVEVPSKYKPGPNRQKVVATAYNQCTEVIDGFRCGIEREPGSDHCAWHQPAES